MIPILILAAGQSSRMGGRDKLLEHIGGTPILRLLTDRAQSVGPTFVTLPAQDHPRRDVLPPATQVVTIRGEMSDSIKAGITALPAAATGVIILLVRANDDIIGRHGRGSHPEIAAKRHYFRPPERRTGAPRFRHARRLEELSRDPQLTINFASWFFKTRRAAAHPVRDVI